MSISKLQRLWLLISSLGAGLFLSLSTANAYVTDTFVCEVEANTVVVALENETRDGDEQFDSCFAMLEALENEIVLLNDNIQRADQLIAEGREVEYWSATRTSLQEQQALYKRSQTQLINAIDDFERELFIRIKTIAYVILGPEREELINDIRTTEALLVVTQRRWSTEQYALVRRGLSQLQKELFYIDAIQRASTFGQLLPALKVYFSVQWPLL